MRSTLLNPLTFLLLTFFSISSLASLQKPRNHRAHFRRQNNGTSSDLSAVVQGMQARRIDTIFDALRSFMSTDDVTAWLQTLDTNGKWPDNEVDYTVGCDARRANWPAEAHWRRILLMSAAWHGDTNGNNTGNNYVGNVNLQTAILKAMDYWFHRDLTNLQCIHSGGTSACPCDDPSKTFWNTNWFSNVILIPRDVGQVCLLLNTGVLTDYQVGKCKEMTSRSYNLFGQPFAFLEGANILDIAKLGVDGALLASNMTIIADAYQRIHHEMTLKSGIKADGIQYDGSFGQHKGLLYNGNYGKDFINGLVDLELVAVGTEYAAPVEIQASFETLISGSQWMTVRNILTKTTHWDLSALSRFIMFPVADLQATSGLRLTLPSLGQLGSKWGSSIITSFVSETSKDTSSANAGNLVGNRHFYANDYMVHRGANYVSTVKTYSSRTLNSECTNTQNPLGFHLSDNAVRTYLRGDEYEDIAAAWDWYLIPGATIDYGGTPLNCATIKVTGMEDFVGGVSDGTLGISVMRYTNPLTKALRWQKAWFFLNGDVQHVMLSNISSTSSSVRSVIEQRRQRGPIVLDGQEVSSMTVTRAETLWHGDIGYIFSNVTDAGRLVVDSKQATGNWESIGTSTQPSANVQLFSAWIEHSRPFASLSYSILPGVSQHDFSHKRSKLKIRTLRSDDSVSSIYDEANGIVYAVFWQPAGGSITFETKAPKVVTITLTAQNSLTLIYKIDKGEITVSDPSQKLSNTVISWFKEPGKHSKKGASHGPQKGSRHDHHHKDSNTGQISIDFPTGGMSGKSVTRLLSQ